MSHTQKILYKEVRLTVQDHGLKAQSPERTNLKVDFQESGISNLFSGASAEFR